MQFVVVFLLLFGLVPSSFSAPHREGLPLLAPDGIGGIFEGPDSETIIRGPDGSEITSEQKSGAIIREDGLENRPIVVADIEPLQEAPILAEERIEYAGPIISSTRAPLLEVSASAVASPGPILVSQSTPLLTEETYGAASPNTIEEEQWIVPETNVLNSKPIEIVQQDPHIIETEIIEAPEAESDQSADLKGASGRIITKGSSSIVSGPASTTITEPRKIILAPPKIAPGIPVVGTATIPLQEVSVASSVQSYPTLSNTAVTSLDASSALPPVLRYSTTAAPIEYGYSTTATPSVELGTSRDLESTRINLGVNDFRQSIPVIEYSSSNGVLNEPALSSGITYSSTETPIVSSTINTITTDRYAPPQGPTIPPAYQVSSATSGNLAAYPRASGLASSNIQKIPRLEDSIAVDGRVAMDYPHNTFTSNTYQLPSVLEMALTRFYQKYPVKNSNSVNIDDKMGELIQNEIISYDDRQQYLPPPDLSQSRYIGPALARNGVDASQVNLASVPLSQVTKFANDGYQRAYLSNRYERNAKTKRSY